MPREKDNVLESNQYMKPDKMPYIIYADIESSIKKTDGWANDSEKSLTTKICEHIPCGYSVSTTWSFGNIENKHTLYRGENCMKKFCTFLREHATNVIKFAKKMLPLTKKSQKHTKTEKHIIFVEKES